ncbi:uncharacterized protein N7458_011338 [Penicillium daleae]|uniref:Uncharacterized protein n=1 Tax=Penicillium daleae TaxID=63821 RepID=A0AAD6FWC9_9EURO|nr:uncharacterized protein N7458_011338 [Penicillium daleae]KAJ5432182.1 hypothetical protein N7458_011338 [Penicillium daleae]
MQGNQLIALLIGILLLIITIGWLVYCWYRRHVNMGVMISQARARVRRERRHAQCDVERGSHGPDYPVPKYTHFGWVRPKLRYADIKEPEYVVLRRLNDEGSHYRAHTLREGRVSPAHAETRRPGYRKGNTRPQSPNRSYGHQQGQNQQQKQSKKQKQKQKQKKGNQGNQGNQNNQGNRKNNKRKNKNNKEETHEQPQENQQHDDNHGYQEGYGNDQENRNFRQQDVQDSNEENPDWGEQGAQHNDQENHDSGQQDVQYNGGSNNGWGLPADRSNQDNNGSQHGQGNDGHNDPWDSYNVQSPRVSEKSDGHDPKKTGQRDHNQNRYEHGRRNGQGGSSRGNGYQDRHSSNTRERSIQTGSSRGNSPVRSPVHDRQYNNYEW